MDGANGSNGTDRGWVNWGDRVYRNNGADRTARTDRLYRTYGGSNDGSHRISRSYGGDWIGGFGWGYRAYGAYRTRCHWPDGYCRRNGTYRGWNYRFYWFYRSHGIDRI